MRYRYFLSFILLAACSSSALEPTADSIVLTEPDSTDRKQIRSIPSAQARSTEPSEVILQYDVLGGLMGGRPGTNIPLWTLYGDGLLVWTEDGTPTPGFSRQVWIGHVTQEEISELEIFLNETGYWDLETSYQLAPYVTETAPSSDDPGSFTAVVPNPEAAFDQPTGVLMAMTSGRRHQIAVFPANWEGAPEAYHSVRQRVLETRPADAHQFQPDSFSLRARELPQAMVEESRIATWAFEIPLDAAMNEPLKLAEDQGISVAKFIQANGQKVTQDGNVYLVTLLGDPPR